MYTLFGVYKKIIVGDIDEETVEVFVVGFENEDDAREYVRRNNRPFLNDGYGENSNLLSIKPITIVKAGTFNPANNYGLVESAGDPFICECGHATALPLFGKPLYDPIEEDGVVVGIREYQPITCSLCGKQSFLYDNRLMFNSKDETIRCKLSAMGYNLENYIHDPSFRVRENVAMHGVGFDVFIANPNEHPAVLRTIAKRGEYLDILMTHPDASVRNTALKAAKKAAGPK